jgi:hypothetical protein
MKHLRLCLLVLPILPLAMVAAASCGQTQSQPAGTPPGPTQPPPPATPKQGKVWTNDDVEQMPGNQGVTAAGHPAGSKKTTAPAPAAPYLKDPAWYRKQLTPLQADVEKLDPQIAKLKAFLSGENVSDPQPWRHGPPGNVPDQLDQMEKKREADMVKINDLMDLARHNGILPGQLR